MRRAASIVAACAVLAWAVSVVPSVGADSPPGADAPAAPAAGEPVGSTGVAEGVDSVLVRDAATVQLLLGASDRVEAGNANAYIATYSPEFNTGYFAVTTDQGITSSQVRARLEQLGGSSAASDTDAGLQTVIVFSKYSSSQIEESLEQLTASAEATTGGTAFYYDPATDSILLTAPQGFSVPATSVQITNAGGEVRSDY